MAPDDQTSIIERVLTRLTNTIRAQTQYTLRVEQLLVSVNGKLDQLIARHDHLIASELEEANNIREIRSFLFDASEKITQTHHGVTEARRELEETSDKIAKLEEVTGTHRLPTQEELARMKKPGVLEALGVLVDKAKEMPAWLRWFGGTAIGGGIVHLLHRIFHF